jgi:Cu/Zn superoxide dismutase
MKGISMFTWYFMRRKRLAFWGPVVLTLLLLAGCGITDTASQPSSASQSSRVTTPASSGVAAMATLTHEPTGNAALNWNYKDQMLTVQISLTGLAPNSTHPVHIHEGSCGQNGKMLYPLLNLVADARGVASGTSKISAPKGISASGWYINIHNGPGLSNNDQSLAILCGHIVNQDTSLRSNQAAQVPLDSSPSAKDQAAKGVAHLSISNQSLTIQMSLSGLSPYSQHAAHIHAGSCASQGPIIYTLPTLKADAQGNATISATFKNVTSIPATGWYVNVHYGTDLSTQTGFDPIACGDVMLN